MFVLRKKHDARIISLLSEISKLKDQTNLLSDQVNRQQKHIANMNRRGPDGRFVKRKG